VRLILSERAHREVLRIDEHWRSVADHRSLFLEELEAMLARLESGSNLGVPNDAATNERVWRTRLVKSQYYVCWFILFLAGCVFLARAKGRDWYFGLLGLLSIVGVGILWFAVADGPAANSK
jgi:hypothetical protein